MTQRIIADAEVKTVFGDVATAPARIYDAQTEHINISNRVATLARDVAEAKQGLVELRGEIAVGVANEMTTPLEAADDEAKKKFKPKQVYPNIEARTIETDKRCRHNDGYQATLTHFRKVEASHFAATTELEEQAAKVKLFTNALGAHKAILGAIAGLSNEETHSAGLKAIARFLTAVNQVKGEISHEN